MKGDLEKIAREMRNLAVDQSPRPIRHLLRRGLNLTLKFSRGEWHLTLLRMEVDPSAGELATCRAAFGVPPDALVSPPVVGNSEHEHLIAITWTGPARQVESEKLL